MRIHIIHEFINYLRFWKVSKVYKFKCLSDCFTQNYHYHFAHLLELQSSHFLHKSSARRLLHMSSVPEYSPGLNYLQHYYYFQKPNSTSNMESPFQDSKILCRFHFERQRGAGSHYDTLTFTTTTYHWTLCPGLR